MNYQIPLLPLAEDIESKAVLRKCAKAHQALAELKGIVATIPNESILINTLSLQEAKDSSAIENIITTHDELFKSDNVAQQFTSLAAKEVLKGGFKKTLTTKATVKLAYDALKAATDDDDDGISVEMALIELKTGKVKVLSQKDVDEMLKA